MGQSSFYNRSRGKSMSDAYNKAYEEDKDEHGHEQGYSGSLCSADSPSDITSEFKRSGKTLNAFIDSKNPNKRDCFGICIKEPKSNTNKIKSQVEHIVTKGTKKWVLVYVVTTYRGDEIASKKTKGDALKIAREYTEKNNERTYVGMEKRLEGVNNRVAVVTYKSSQTESEGEYIFFGSAPD